MTLIYPADTAAETLEVRDVRTRDDDSGELDLWVETDGDDGDVDLFGVGPVDIL